MQDLADWVGQVPTRSDPSDGLYVAAPSPAGGTWSGPFRATASDGADYFVKSLDTCADSVKPSLASERIVADAGVLIGAPVCPAVLIRITAEIAGFELRPGTTLSAGLAHANKALEHAEDTRSMELRSKDDNSRRHVGIYALYDWCFGSDQQWLRDLNDDSAYFSHDHGLYFPPHNGTLDVAALQTHVDQPHPLGDDARGLLPTALEETATALESVTGDSLRAILGTIPASWPISDTMLEAVGWFLYRRREGVAARLRSLK